MSGGHPGGADRREHSGAECEDGCTGDDEREERERESEINDLQALAREVSVDDAGEELRGDEADRRSDDAARESEGARFDEENVPYVAVGCADGFEHTDFASSFSDRGEHRVGDTERSDRERDKTDAGEHEFDDVQVSLDLCDERLGCARRVPDIVDLCANDAHILESVCDDEQGCVGRWCGAELVDDASGERPGARRACDGDGGEDQTVARVL